MYYSWFLDLKAMFDNEYRKVMRLSKKGRNKWIFSRNKSIRVTENKRNDDKMEKKDYRGRYKRKNTFDILKKTRENENEEIYCEVS